MGILSSVSRRLRDLSIRHKLILVTALTSSTAILLALGIFLVLDLSSFREALKRDLHVMADIVAPGTSAALAFQDVDEAVATLQGLAAEPRIVAGCVYGRDDRLFAADTHDEGRECPAEPPPPGWDPERFVERLGGDRELACEMARLFIADVPRALGAVDSAVQSGDRQELRRAAHALKGAVLNFAGGPATEAGAELERIGHGDAPGDPAPVHAELVREMDRLVKALRAFGEADECAS